MPTNSRYLAAELIPCVTGGSKLTRVRYDGRSSDVLLPDNGAHPAAAAAGLLGLPDTARVPGTLLPPATSSSDYCKLFFLFNLSSFTLKRYVVFFRMSLMYLRYLFRR